MRGCLCPINSKEIGPEDVMPIQPSIIMIDVYLPRFDFGDISPMYAPTIAISAPIPIPVSSLNIYICTMSAAKDTRIDPIHKITIENMKAGFLPYKSATTVIPKAPITYPNIVIDAP